MDARFVSVPRTRGEAQTRNMTSNGPRRAIVAAIVGASGLVLCSAAAQPRLEPFVPVGVTYRVRSVAAAKQSAGDLQSIRAAGFNVIRTVVSWADAEDVRGEYNLAAMEALLRAGGDAGLRVVVQVDTRPAPGWVLQRYPDGRFVADASTGSERARDHVCLDHPQVRADALAFVAAVAARAAGHAAWFAVDVASDFPPSFCLCPHTQQAFRDWASLQSRQPRRGTARTGLERDTFLAVSALERSRALANASSARGGRLVTNHTGVPSVLRGLEGWRGQDDWLMRGAFDHYGTSIQPDGTGLSTTQWLFGLDGIASAARDRGWWWIQEEAESAAAPGAVRERMWTAVSRGARGLVVDGWPEGAGVKEAGDVARVIARNPALFAPLRPAPAAVAILYDPRDDRPLSARMAPYGALLERNVAVDLVHVDEVAAGRAGGYSAVLDAAKPIEAALREATAPAARHVRIDGGAGVETRFIESSDVILLIGLNHSDRSQRVTMRFPPDTQEAIWQNMETGAAVNFVAAADGPTYTHTFAARGTLVLMIRKSVR
jgi:hypothetical protein